MTLGEGYALAGAALCGLALFGWLANTDLLRRILAFNIMGSGTFLVLVGLTPGPVGSDPVPQALALTGIVVAVAATAVALALMRRWYRASGSPRLGEDEET